MGLPGAGALSQSLTTFPPLGPRGCLGVSSPSDGGRNPDSHPHPVPSGKRTRDLAPGWGLVTWWCLPTPSKAPVPSRRASAQHESTSLTRKADHLLGWLVKGVYGAGTSSACPQWAPQVQGRTRQPKGPQISDGDQLAWFTPVPVPHGREEGLRNTCVQYFGHLMRRVDSMEKTLMLGGIGGRRGRGRQRMRQLDGALSLSTRG